LTDDQEAHEKTLTGVALRDVAETLGLMLVDLYRNAAFMR
jgi:hypothetical protein